MPRLANSFDQESGGVCSAQQGAGPGEEGISFDASPGWGKYFATGCHCAVWL